MIIQQSSSVVCFDTSSDVYSLSFLSSAIAFGGHIGFEIIDSERIRMFRWNRCTGLESRNRMNDEFSLMTTFVLPNAVCSLENSRTTL